MLKLSYIIPCYNGEKFIVACLDNVFGQDLAEDEYEVICVNDCSTDHSRDLILHYAENHANLFL
ncbi:MAG: glycosyltransferase, partial [Paludibacter sp.]|nr:glycosyltransferase [Paludibacter sp.]